MKSLYSKMPNPSKKYNNENEPEKNEAFDIKYLKDLQTKILDLEKNFKSYCIKVNIDNLKSDVKNLNESINDLNSSFNKDLKSLMENLSN